MKQHKGVWLPDGEQHLIEMMQPKAKRYAELPDGRPTYQRHKYLRALGLVKERQVFVDIGAHVGLWSMQAALDFQRIVAFEPCREHADIYPHNVSGVEYELHPVALGEREGEVGLEGDGHSTGGTHVDLKGTGVPVFTLDSFDIRRADLVKIDVEGFELPVLRGAQETILRTRPVIVLEQKGRDFDHYGGRPREGLAFLFHLGMRELAPSISGDYFLGW